MSDMSQLDPRSLVVFHEIVRAGSLSGAARRLGWTHPAVSAHVQRLERACGVKLLERHGRGMRPTSAGQQLAHLAADLSATMTRAQRLRDDLRRDGERRVRIAAFPTASSTIVVDAVSALGAAVSVQLIPAEPPQALRMLTSGAADIALIFDGDTDVATEGVEPSPSITLLTDRSCVLVPKGHELADRGTVSCTDLQGYTVIAGCPSCRALLSRHAAREDVTLTMHHQGTDDYVMTQAMVASGQGVAVLPGLALNAHQRDDLVALDLDPQLRRRVSAHRAPNGDEAVAHVMTALMTASQRYADR